jgi:hypothetical protein
MATIRQAAKVDMKGWEPMPSGVQGGFRAPSVPDESNTPGRSSTMLSAMPPAATTGDGLQRQFYGGVNIPVMRILPNMGRRV